MRAFSGLAPSKLIFFSICFNCSIIVYIVFYLPFFRGIEMESLRYQKLCGPERVNFNNLNKYVSMGACKLGINRSLQGVISPLSCFVYIML